MVSHEWIFTALLAICLVALSPAPASAQTSLVGCDLKVSENGHYLTHRDGKPFFYLADTAWELFARLNREEVVEYLDDRKAKGFTVIQTAFLALHEGANAYGHEPVIYKILHPITTPGSNASRKDEYDWWDHADFVVREITKRGFYLAVAPFRQQLAPKDAADAEEFGKFLGRRYRTQTNMIWLIGFDPSVEQIEAEQNLYRGLARGIAKGLDNGTEDYARTMMTFHPSGPNTSSRWFHEDAFLDFNTIQTGHRRDTEVWKMIASDYERKPAKPVIDAEATYESHPVGNVRDAQGEKVYSDAADVRKYAYWGIFAGAFGHTYGHHSVWQMHVKGRDDYGARETWREALSASGAMQMRHLRTLIESRPILSRVPDQSLVEDDLTGGDRIQATRGDGYAFVYSAQGQAFTVRMGKISGEKMRACWYDPRTGTVTIIGEFGNTGAQQFTPPNAGREHDWVLILDDVARKFPLPDKTGTLKQKL